MSRRLLIAALLGVLLFSTPALAGLTIADRQQASTDLTTGPQFFAFGTGTNVAVGGSTAWEGFTFEGIEIDEESGALTLGSSGDVTPSDTPWHDAASTSRACETAPAQNVRALTFDVEREIDLGRMRASLADIGVFAVGDGATVPFRTGSPDATTVVVDTTAFAEPVAVCVYWGDLNAVSQSSPDVQGAVIPDGGWSWRVWEDAGDGLSLDLVDWTAAPAVGAVPTGAAPSNVCNQCANELVGFVTPTVSGSYQFFLSADDVGRFELAPLDDPAGLAMVIELSAATPAGDFTDPLQASGPVDLVADQAYAIRARSKDLEATDHLEIAWAMNGEAPALLPTEAISDADGLAGTLTHHRFDVVATADRSGEPSSTTRIESSEKSPNSGNNVANSISGYVVIPETGTYRFWISSDDEGALRLATNGDPASADRVAWLTNFSDQDDWTADPSQRSAAFELLAGQTIWIEAHNRDRGGPDHLQVGWSRDDPAIATNPATASDTATASNTAPPATPQLLPPEVLSESPPVEAPLPTAELGSTEGQQSASGTFVSAPIDTSSEGSNVFGLLDRQTSGAVQISVSFANDPAGPWSAPVDVVDGVPAPLDADGVRYVRFSGSMTADEDGPPLVTSLGIERDIAEAVSSNATTTVPATGEGDEVLLRVRGSIGTPSTAQIVPTGGGVAAFTLATSLETGMTDVRFESGMSHHVVVSALPGTDTATARWSVVDDRGATISHDIVVAIN